MKYLRPVVTMVMGEDGVLKRRVTKKTAYRCDLGQGGRGGKLRQTRLSSFSSRTGSNNLGDNSNDDPGNSTPSLGQE